MARLFRSVGLSEGEFVNKFFRRRLLEKNQNCLGSITGSTGSGKTYSAISILDNYYNKVLNKPFPIENIVFSPKQMIDRLRYFEKYDLRAEFLLAEEWGVNNSALEFQNKTQKMLSYVMQSFRSMNVGILMTLPVLTMLSKSTRQLLHFHFITSGIDYNTKRTKLKPFFHQLNQSSGKSFWKYPKVRINKRLIKLKKLNISHPNKEIVDKYELLKQRFVGSLLKDFSDELDRKELEEKKKLMRPLLTKNQLKFFELMQQGKTNRECQDILNIKHASVASRRRKAILIKGYDTKNIENA